MKTIYICCAGSTGVCSNGFSKRKASYIMSQNRYRPQTIFVLFVFVEIMYVYHACLHFLYSLYGLILSIRCMYSLIYSLYVFIVRIHCLHSLCLFNLCTHDLHSWCAFSVCIRSCIRCMYSMYSLYMYSMCL